MSQNPADDEDDYPDIKFSARVWYNETISGSSLTTFSSPSSSSSSSVQGKKLDLVVQGGS